MHPDHIGGNEKIGEAGKTITGGNVIGDIGDATEGATIVAHEKVLDRLSPNGTPTVSFKALPTLTFLGDQMKLSQFFNGEGIQIFHEKPAHTDGDSIVFFRGSDVISAGDIFLTTSYPIIDLANGGSLQGVIDALNHILDMSVAEFRTEGGTLVIPGHGRICDTADVAYYRDMATIVRDRIRGHAEERHDAGAGEGRQAHRGLGSALRQEHLLDAGYVCGSGLQEFKCGEKVMRRILIVAMFATAGYAQRPATPPRTGQAAAPFDLTGYWVSQIVDEWRFRVTPQKGDIAYLPINADARKIALAWDPDKDLAEGTQCKAYGAVGVMQRPGRLHVSGKT